LFPIGGSNGSIHWKLKTAIPLLILCDWQHCYSTAVICFATRSIS
jgi:hypothetical protein